ncbi:MAG: putative lipid II flippase FtsW, partial [Gemmatimonadota bacterium]|nr:putative lipid II flippase FtsW [Gemmatimonadota bacterium]
VTGALIGAVLFVAASRIDYHNWERFAWPILLTVVVMLLIVLIPFLQPLTREVNGARRWIDLKFFSFQPAEFAKFAAVAWTAMLATKKGDQIREFKSGLLPFLVVIGPLAGLVLVEPALSMSVSICLLAAIVLFAAGAKIGHFLMLLMVAMPFLWQQIMTVHYRFQRWSTFFSPGTDVAESSWQIRQSLIGIGAGRIFGQGFGQGTQKMGYLPYGYSDFIFSTIGEEWGFIGVVALLGLFGVFVWLGLKIAEQAQDRFGTLLAVGITSMIGVTAFLHIAVTLGVVPTTGLPLPFVSFGRSNLIVSMFAAGVLANIGDRSMGRSKRW